MIGADWGDRLGEGAGQGKGPVLLAVAHGSRDPRAALVVEELIAQVRALRPGLRVAPAHLDHGEPSLPDALAALREGADRVVVVPLLLSAGYHVKIDIPGAVAAHPGVRCAPAIGPHRALLTVLRRRLVEAGFGGVPGASPDSEAVSEAVSSPAVVLAAAGSSDPAANDQVAQVARDLGAHPAFVSGAGRPRVADAVERLRAAGHRRVAIAPYFLAPGRLPETLHHAGADIVADVLGAAPEIAELILERYSALVA